MLFLLALFLAVADAADSSGCGSKLASGYSKGGDSNTVKIKSGGTSRTYNLYVPEDYKIATAAPLILSFHGGGQSASDQEELSQMSNPLFNTEAIAVYPQGLDVCSRMLVAMENMR